MEKLKAAYEAILEKKKAAAQALKDNTINAFILEHDKLWTLIETIDHTEMEVNEGELYIKRKDNGHGVFRFVFNPSDGLWIFHGYQSGTTTDLGVVKDHYDEVIERMYDIMQGVVNSFPKPTKVDVCEPLPNHGYKFGLRKYIFNPTKKNRHIPTPQEIVQYSDDQEYLVQVAKRMSSEDAFISYSVEVL